MGTLRRIPGTDRWWEDPQTLIKYLEVYVDHQRRRVSSGETDLDKAQRKRRDLERTAREKYKIRKPKGLPTFEEAWDEWIETTKVMWRLGTLADIQSVGKVHLKPYYGKYLVAEVADAELWKKYVAHKYAQRPGCKLARHHAYFTMFLNAQFEAGKIPRVPALYDPDPEVDAAVVIARSEQARVLRFLRNHEDAEDMLLGFMMAITLGMREYEIFDLKKDRIDAKNWFIRLRADDVKTGKPRSIPIVHRWIRAQLSKRIARAGSDFIFPSPKDPGKSRWFPQRAWNLVREKTGIEITFHNTRHTAATRFSKLILPTVAARILGMSLDVYDRKYCRTQEEDLMSAMVVFTARGR